MKKLSIIFVAMALALAFTVPAIGASTTDTLLQRIASNHGNGVDAFTLDAISGIYVGTGSTVTAQVVDASDTWAILSDAVGTPSPLTLTVTAGVTGTVDYNAGTNTWTIAVNGSTERTPDCSSISITACAALINALDISDGSPEPTIVATVTNNMGFGLPENIAAEDNAVAAGTLVFTTAMDAGTAEDLTVDCSDTTLNECVTLLNSLDNAGGLAADFTFIVEGTQNGDLTNSANDIANEGPTDLTSAVQFPFTSDDAPASYVENTDFNSVGYVAAYCDFTAGTCLLRIYDGSTLVWVSEALSDTTRTNFSFNPAVSSTGSTNLTIQLFSEDAMIVNTLMYVLGSQ